jgi:hypothetical protein
MASTEASSPTVRTRTRAGLAHVAGGDVAVVARQRLDDLLAGDAQREQPREVELHAQLAHSGRR